MITVLGCVVEKHNLWLVLVAALICGFGSWSMIRLFDRAHTTSGLQQAGWHFLTAVAAGTSIWCTHFIAMLAYEPGVPVDFDPVLTIGSLFVAIVGGGLGLVIASSLSIRFAAGIGGGVLGLAIAVMHYAGMAAYRPEGIVSWDMSYLRASIFLSVSLSAVAMHLVMRGKTRSDRYAAAALLFLAILGLHFTGMTAFKVSPMMIDHGFTNPAAMRSLALVVACAAVLILGASFASWTIDDSARREAVERLQMMAHTDYLTGLPNRASFNERLQSEIAHASATGGKVILVGIDLNRFKEINDVRGHGVGDTVLRILSQRMAAMLREGEFVARVGGDEFAAVQRASDSSRLEDFIGRLKAAFSDSVRIGECEILPGASLGVAIYPENACSSESLISNADLAMYRAKSDITHAVGYYDKAMDETVRARRNLANDLREAMENHQLAVHYQVQTSISTGEIRGYEALLRWTHPVHGAISPAEFIPLAEESGLILELGEWVLREACSRAASWQPQYKVAVNLSPVQLLHSDLPKLVLEVLLDTGLRPDRLELELTESTIFADKERALRILRRIRAMGVSIALDDFGTGYSSLDTLRSFPFDKIKLDRTFMSEIEASPQAKAIIRAMLALGKSLGIPILAEGIETEGQLALLHAEGCDEAQGYLLGRPIPIEQLLLDGQIRRQREDVPESGPVIGRVRRLSPVAVSARSA